MGVYTVWLVLGSISFILSWAVLISILLRRKTWSMIFHQLSALLALFDLLANESWFLGNKYSDTAGDVCGVQEYMFQAGMLGKATVSVAICYISMKVVVSSVVPTGYLILKLLGVLFALVMILLTISIQFSTYKVHCDGDRNEFHPYSFAYIFSFLAPMYACALVDIVLCVIIYNHVRDRREGPPLGGGKYENRQGISDPLHALVRRLRFYPIIFVVGVVPELVAIIVSTGEDEKSSQVAMIFSAIGFSSIGIGVSVYYFYQQLSTSSSVYASRIKTLFTFSTSRMNDQEEDFVSDEQYGCIAASTRGITAEEIV